MHILHTESSTGWGGQEIRIFKESLGLREQGFTITLAVVRGGKLVSHARKEGLNVVEVDFKRSHALQAVWQLCKIIRQNKIDVVNTHSSLDAWLGGVAARICRRPVVRTRHLSTAIRRGLNSRLLYNGLADFVVTTSSCTASTIAHQAKLPPSRIQCIPTGVQPFTVSPTAIEKMRASLKVKPDQILIGSVCVVRSWKGIQDLIKAAELLRHDPRLRWVVVGGGYLDHFKPLVDPDLPFIFTGHLENPEAALAALDIFALLSTAHEGISQASLQAAFLKKPLITTTIGGLPEICLDGKTGFTVPPSSPSQFVEAVLKLSNDPMLRKQMGQAAHDHIINNYTLRHTLNDMARTFQNCRCDFKRSPV
jgi:glycosyltransferase involved in cell wall biosynthesis